MERLIANGKNEKLILDYIEKNASDILKEKIEAGTKTLAQCWGYIVSEAKKKAQNGCAVVDDQTVFGWAIHFFEEDSVKAKDYNVKAEAKTSNNTKPITTPKKEKPKQDSGFEQLAFF